MIVIQSLAMNNVVGFNGIELSVLAVAGEAESAKTAVIETSACKSLQLLVRK